MSNRSKKRQSILLTVFVIIVIAGMVLVYVPLFYR
jgi:hypothetical protein